MSVKASGMFDQQKVDWQAFRETIDLVEVTTRLLGPAPGRRGERGRKLWWSCPLHEDPNPSFAVEPGSGWWRCFGCGEKGDAAALVMKAAGMSFPEAKDYLTGGPAPSVPAGPPHQPRAAAKPRAVLPKGMSLEAIALLVEATEFNLWLPQGAKALGYLRGRGLSDDTIRAARLGWTDSLGWAAWKSPGVVIPWWSGERLALVKVRPPDRWRERFPEARRPPKYIEAYRDPSLAALYPGPEAIRPGRPLIVVEGELDCLLLAQELGDLAGVVTLGSASAGPDPALRGKMLPAWPWYVATDSDEAGDKAAGRWPSSARRVRPPGAFKDWGEARQGGIDLRRWWAERLAGDEDPTLFTWGELTALCWGPAVVDPEPGLIVDGPDRARMLAALSAVLADPGPEPADWPAGRHDDLEPSPWCEAAIDGGPAR